MIVIVIAVIFVPDSSMNCYRRVTRAVSHGCAELSVASEGDGTGRVRVAPAEHLWSELSDCIGRLRGVRRAVVQTAS